MRIALVNNFFPPRAGGSAHFTEELARRLGALGHDVLVVTTADNAPAGWEERDTYQVYRVPSWSLPVGRLAFNYDLAFSFSPRNVRRIWRVLDGFRPDLIHQHNQVLDLSLLSSVWARRRRVPVLVTIHTALIHTEPLPRLILWLMDRCIARLFIAISRAHLVAPDVFIVDYIANRYRLPEERVVRITIGIDLSRFEAAPRSDLRAELGLGERPVVLSLGHVIPLRDRMALVEALPRLRRRIPDVVVVVAGHTYDDRFLKRARALGVGDAILCLGAVPRSQVPMLTAIADLETHDLQGYGFGTASLEVMGAGIPVVAAVRPDNFPGLELRDGEQLLIVPLSDPKTLADALASLLQDRELRTRLGKGGRDFVLDHFSIERITGQYLETYARLTHEVPLVPDV